MFQGILIVLTLFEISSSLLMLRSPSLFSLSKSEASLKIFVGEFEYWSIVTSVEFTDSHISTGGPTYSLGSLEITNKQFSSYSDSNLSTFVLISFFAFGIAYIFVKK